MLGNGDLSGPIRLQGPFLAPLLIVAFAGSASAQSLAGGLTWSSSAGSDTLNSQSSCGIVSADCTPGQVYAQTGAVAGTLDDPCGSLDNVPAKAAFSMSESVNYGLIEGFATTSAQVSRQETNSTGCEWKAETFADAQAAYGFSDQLTITSGTLSQGTPVQIKFTMFLTSKVASAGVPLALYCNGELSAESQMNFGENGGLSTLAHSKCSGANAQKASVIVTSAVGAVQYFSGSLDISAATDEYLDRSEFPWGPKGETAIGNSITPSIARYTVEVVTRGASYVAASGTVYPTK